MHAAANVPVERDQPGIHRPRHLLPRRENEAANVRQQRRDATRGLGGNFGEREFLGMANSGYATNSRVNKSPAPAPASSKCTSLR